MVPQPLGFGSCPGKGFKKMKMGGIMSFKRKAVPAINQHLNKSFALIPQYQKF
jgi:hypothetical protein